MGCQRFILHGNPDNETRRAQKVLEGRNIPYRLEINPEDLERQIVLSTPAGRYKGIREIEFAFGKRKYAERQ